MFETVLSETVFSQFLNVVLLVMKVLNFEARDSVYAKRLVSYQSACRVGLSMFCASASMDASLVLSGPAVLPGEKSGQLPSWMGCLFLYTSNAERCCPFRPFNTSGVQQSSAYEAKDPQFYTALVLNCKGSTSQHRKCIKISLPPKAAEVCPQR